jgi:hypothetical protein
MVSRKTNAIVEMIYIYENFLSSSECNFYIDFFNQRFHAAEQFRNTFVLRDISDPFLLQKFSIIENKFQVSLNYFEIVKWPKNSYQDWHQDGKINTNNNFTGIIYLNDNYEGGETVIEDQIVAPAIGKFIFFQGSKLTHKVNEIVFGSRYTIPCWFKII